MQTHTVTELSKRWKISRNKVLRLISSGKLIAFDVSEGRVPRWRIREADVTAFEESRMRGLERRGEGGKAKTRQGFIDFASQRRAKI